MAQDWAIDVKRYDADADDGVINAIVNYCGIALQSRDGQLVAYKDQKELDLVRENYLKKKLGLTNTDSELDGAIAAVGERMKDVTFKNRVTVYYLLAQHLGALGIFGGASTASSGGLGLAAGAAAAGAGALGIASMGGAAAADDATPAATISAAPAVSEPAAEPAYAARSYDEDDSSGGGLSWLWWLLGALLLLGLIWWFFLRGDKDAVPVTSETPASEVTAPAEVPSEDAANVAAAAPEADDVFAGVTAEGSAAVPTGSGATLELRDGRPVAKVYFNTAKTDVSDQFAPIAEKFKAYLAKNPGAVLGISGYNDPRGDAAKNAELSKNRAQAVQADLVKAGIAETSTELIKPEAVTQGSGDDAAARRVEVYIKPAA
ncbi:MAG: DUF2853 family protein [Sphingomonadales bacterium]|nr:DUF2853 family protein [Sphingomonadales bacterium]